MINRVVFPSRGLQVTEELDGHLACMYYCLQDAPTELISCIKVNAGFFCCIPHTAFCWISVPVVTRAANLENNT